MLVLVPLRIAFGLDVDFASGAFWLDACVDIYFIADIFMVSHTVYSFSYRSLTALVAGAIL